MKQTRFGHVGPNFFSRPMSSSSPLTVDVSPMEPLCFHGTVSIKCTSGKVRILGVELSSSDSEWLTVHSPAGGLTACLQTASAISSGARVSMVRVTPEAPAPRRKGQVVNKRKAATAADDLRRSTGLGKDNREDMLMVDEEIDEFEYEGEDQDEGKSPEGMQVSDPSTPFGQLEARLGLKLFRAPTSIPTRIGVTGVPLQWQEALDWLAPVMAAGEKARAGAAAATPAVPAAPTPAAPKANKKAAAKAAAAAAASGAQAAAAAAQAEQAAAAATSPVIVLCGARNVGKSSFARLLLNLALGEGASSVRFLECDIGQSELTPPSLVALHDVTSPLLGPPHTHLRPHRNCRFVGDATPATAPRKYVECIASLLEEHCRPPQPSGKQQDEKQEEMGGQQQQQQQASVLDGSLPRPPPPPPPLLLNTCGWVTGLGGQLLADIVACARPTVVVMIEGAASAASYPNAEPQQPLEALEAAAAAGAQIIRLPALPSTAAGGNGNGGVDVDALAYDDVAEEAAGATAGGAGGGANVSGGSGSSPLPGRRSPSLTTPRMTAPPSQECRTLQLLAYFGVLPDGVRRLPGVPAGYSHPRWQGSLASFHQAPPFAVPMSAFTSIAVRPSDDPTGGAGGQMSARHVAMCLNASFVGLLRPGGTHAGADHHRAPSLASHECVGLALVRSVDVESSILFLSTPVPVEQLVGVTALARSTLDVPLALLQPTVLTPPSPFLSMDALAGAGGQRMRSRNNLVRGPRATKA